MLHSLSEGVNIYEKDNKELLKSFNSGSRVVFIGDSITAFWPEVHPIFFSVNDFIGRGIECQTSFEILSRFREDVITLEPAGVVIGAGTNDIGCTLYPWYNEERTLSNIASMAEIANANGIKVFIASVLPVTKFEWAPNLEGFKENIVSLNKLLKTYCSEKGHEYIDYYSVLATEDNSMNPTYSKDGIHPNSIGYFQMEKIVSPLIRKHIELIVKA